MSDALSPVVLVHGAWHGPWCWDRVVPLLRERGIETVTVDLPSMDVDAGYVTTVHDDAKTLRAALDALDRPAVVVGHSYGGMVITEGAADHPKVKHLVYLTAFMPDAGESLNDLIAIAPNADLFGELIITDDRRSTLTDAAVGGMFYNDCDDATIAWALSNMRPMLSESGDAVTAAAWRGIPSTYIVCTQDRAVLPELQRHMAKRAGDVIELDASHSAFASQPETLAEVIGRVTNA